MRAKKNTKGFTMIEILMFLTISAGLFLVVLATYSTQNRRTAFTNAVRNFDLRLQDILNDVETGFYPSSDGVACQIGGGGRPVPSPSPETGQGTNQDCIFMGRAIGFSGAGSPEFSTYTIVGNRNAASREGAGLAEARPTYVPFTTNINSIENDLRISKVGSSDGRCGFAIMSGLGQFDGTVAKPGALNVSLYNISCGSSDFAGSLNSTGSYSRLGGNQMITLCIKEPGISSQTARVNIGGHSQKLGTSVIIHPPGEELPPNDPCH